MAVAFRCTENRDFFLAVAIKHYNVRKAASSILQWIVAQMLNQSTEGAEFVWGSECQKGEGCEIINQFVFV
jgi:hypothetical protein